MRGEKREKRISGRGTRRRTTRRFSQLETLEDRKLFAVDIAGPVLSTLGTFEPQLPKTAETAIVDAISEPISPDQATAGQVATGNSDADVWGEDLADLADSIAEGFLSLVEDVAEDDVRPPHVASGYTRERIESLWQLNESSDEEFMRNMMDSDWYESFNLATRNDVGFGALNPEIPRGWLGVLQDMGTFIYEFGAEIDNNLPSGSVGAGIGGNVQFFNLHASVQLDVYVAHDANAASWWNTWTIGIGPTVQSGVDGMGLGVGTDNHVTVSTAPRVSMFERPLFRVWGGHGAEDTTVEYFYAPGAADPDIPPIHGVTVGMGPGLGAGLFADEGVDTILLHSGDPPAQPQANQY